MTEAKKKKLAASAAAKLEQCLAIAGDITDEEAEVLREAKKQVQEERSRYTSVGMIFDPVPSGSDDRVELFDQGIMRITSVLALRSCLERKIKADVGYAKKKMDQESFQKAVGL